MNNLTRRGFLAGGVVAAGAALGAALNAVGHRFGLVPPDAGGVHGAGETLAYASHRIFGRHAMAREFPPSMISAKPFANEIDPPTAVLNAAGVRPEAKYLVYYSTDPEWYESIDIDEAMHSQTLLAWGMNGRELPVPFGGPLRLRVPRQLGYKSVKFLERLVVADNLDEFPAKGSSDLKYGYAWYAGI